MSICSVAVLGENVNLEKMLPRLAHQGGFDSVSALEFVTLEKVYNSNDFFGAIAPDMDFFRNKNQNDFKKYIDTYLQAKSKRVLRKPSEEEFNDFIKKQMSTQVFITKCHF